MTPSTPESPAEISTFRLRRRSPGTFVLIPCPRIGRSLRCQGQLEAAAATILAACPTLITIQEQPLRIWYAWRETPAGLEIVVRMSDAAVLPQAELLVYCARLSG